MILDPRVFRPDEQLRRVFRPGDLFPTSGQNLYPVPADPTAPTPRRWGFEHGVRFADSRALYPFTLEIVVDGAPISPADALLRPSRVTVSGVDSGSDLQLIEDRFLTDDDVAVSVLSVRNAGPDAVRLEVAPRFGLASGPAEIQDGSPLFVQRAAPPLDDLSVHVASGARGTLVFALALATDAAVARSNAQSWQRDPNPSLRQSQQFQSWFDDNAARFDCSDPWLSRLWYHGWHLAWRARGRSVLRPVTASDSPLDSFDGGAFEFPRDDAPAWHEFLLKAVAGFQGGPADRVSLRPDPDAAPHLTHFCVDGLWRGETQFSIVWDDPRVAEDFHDDGEKGFSLRMGRKIVARRDDLGPLDWQESAW